MWIIEYCVKQCKIIRKDELKKEYTGITELEEGLKEINVIR